MNKLERECGDCKVCCFTGGVPDLEKPPHKHCKFECDKGCSIYGKPERPEICNTFKCAYLSGFVDEKPSECGVLLSINNTPNGPFGFAIETKENAFRTTGKDVINDFCGRIQIPVIGSDYKSKPPHDVGDYVFAHNLIVKRCGKIIDYEICKISPSVTMFARKEPLW